MIGDAGLKWTQPKFDKVQMQAINALIIAEEAIIASQEGFIHYMLTWEGYIHFIERIGIGFCEFRRSMTGEDKFVIRVGNSNEKRDGMPYFDAYHTDLTDRQNVVLIILSTP